MQGDGEEDRKKEIYSYGAPWVVYGMDYAPEGQGSNFRLAIGSFREEYSNRLQIIERKGQGFECIQDVEHPYPPTKVLWNPTAHAGMLGTTGDYLRIWTVREDGMRCEAVLNSNKNMDYCSPLTSFDWNRVDTNVIGTSSIDTTCTIWDVSTQQPKTQLIAHDKEVYDIAFSKEKDIFSSVGGDGSVRLFDLRSLEHSTIIYETSDLSPLLRLSWNKQDPNYLATIVTDSSKVVILDIRVPSLPVAELGGHQAAVNSIGWAPHSSCHLCTCGEDSQALIWDLSALPKPISDPILAYNAPCEINQLRWSASHPDWIAIAFEQTIEILRV